MKQKQEERNSVIGVLHGNKNTLTGIIDVAMVGSMYSRGKFNERINSYGMVIMDEYAIIGLSQEAA